MFNKRRGITYRFAIYISSGYAKKVYARSFSKGASPALANELYEYFIQKCAEKLPVSTGQFAADMQVSLTNDGPVTFWLNV